MKTVYQKAGCTVAVVAAFGIAAVHISPNVKVQADSGCSVQTLKGIYAYQNSGFYGSPNGGLAVFAVAGLLTADGNGGVTSIDTSSQNGVITRGRALTGTYQVNPSCTGSLQFSSGNQVFANLDFVLVKGGQAVKFIQTDPGTAISGIAELQTLPVSSSSSNTDTGFLGKLLNR